ncbi:MAG: peptidoglycan DL-endopeptidase CwlO, partial [Actinomycetota bacterium]|nr:peptidoglycan DL-endopeptidase CwlO [Actinomycetota bacterium]
MQFARTTPRHRPRAVAALGIALFIGATGLLSPTTASADPTTAAEAGALVQEAAQRLTVMDEQVHEATLTVAAQPEAADAAAEQAAAAQAALAVYEPQLRAIAQSGYTGKSQSRVAAFLSSDSAAELVQQMTTLDVIAAHTDAVVTEASVAQRAAQDAQAVA